MGLTRCASRAGLHAASPPLCFAPPYLALFLLAGSGVIALHAETFRGCSTVNARILGGYLDEQGNFTDEVLMRDDGRVLSTRHACGSGRQPGGDLDDFSDGLFRFVDCGPNGPVSTSYLTRDGEVILTVPSPDTGRFSEGLSPIEGANGLWGYMDRRGETVISPQFDRASRFSEGVAAVEVKDQWEYIDMTGAAVIRPAPAGKQVENADPFESGLALVLLYNHGGRNSSRVTIDHSGTVVMRDVGEFVEGLAPKVSHGKVGFVDITGKIVIAPQFTGASLFPFREGLAAVFVGEGASLRAGFINRQGQWAIPPRYDDALHFCDGLAPVKIGGRWGYINPSGEMVIAPRFEGAESFDDGMGAVLERNDDGKLHQEFINRKGEILYRETQETQFITIDDSSILRKRCFLFFRCHI